MSTTDEEGPKGPERREGKDVADTVGQSILTIDFLGWILGMGIGLARLVSIGARRLRGRKG